MPYPVMNSSTATTIAAIAILASLDQPEPLSEAGADADEVAAGRVSTNLCYNGSD